MPTADFSMSGLMAQPQYFFAGSSRRRERFIAVGLVLLLHVSVFGAGMLHTEPPSVQLDEMSVSFAQEQSPQAQIVPQPEKPVQKQVVDEMQPEVKKELPVEQSVAAAAPVQESKPVAPSAPVVINTQPDYRADYLNNPRPPYPMVARRMGYHGKVVLNVEVLAEGRAGQVQLHTSSGHEILDNAALQTVKGWHFTPARRLGQPVTEWFLVPVNFSLEDNNA